MSFTVFRNKLYNRSIHIATRNSYPQKENSKGSIALY